MTCQRRHVVARGFNCWIQSLWIPTHRVVFPVPNVQTMLAICATPSATKDVFFSVLPDETS